MGTPEPPEHWAPPESLDPTPVWKQYLLVGLMALAFLGVVGAYTCVAALPDVVTPPAAVPGRVVLAISEHPPGTTKVVAVAGWRDAFYLSALGNDYVAVARWWSPQVGGAELCGIDLIAAPSAGSAARFSDPCSGSTFDVHGRVVSGSAPRGLDRYLVSRKGDRLIVNTDHLIQGKP